MTLRTVFLYESKLLLRSKSFLAAMIIFTIVGLLSVNKAVSYYHYQQQEVDSVMAKQQQTKADLTYMFDSLNFDRKEKYKIENPWTLDGRLSEYAIKPANAMSALSIGQNDIYSQFKSTRFSAEIFSNDQDEFKNPEQLLTGNLDLSYFILFLFPLLFIVLSYNTASADKEAGISRLLATQSKSHQQVIKVRVFYRWMISMLPVFVAAVFAWQQLHNENSFTYANFFQWLLISIVYALFWLSIVLFIITKGWNSMLNAISLAGIWLLLLIGIPGILNSWYQYKYPNYIQQEVTQLRDDKSVYAELPLATHQENFYKTFPTLIKDSAIIDTAELKWSSYALLSLNREKEIYKNIERKTAAQNNKEENLFWINPLGAVMRAFSTTSSTNLESQRMFENEVLNLRTKKIEYLFGNYFSKAHFGKAELAAMPMYKPNTANNKGNLNYLLPVIVLTVLLFVIALLKRKKIIEP